MFEVHITNYNTKTQSYTKVIDMKETEDAALVRFHQAQSDGLSNPDVAWCKTHVETQQGTVIVKEYREKNQPSI